jgi:outer membrane protein assembly factor BamB
MRMRHVLAVLLLCAGGSVLASDFLTEGVDAGRTGWVKDEKIFTTGNVGSSRLLWKLKFDSTPRAMHNLFAPLIAEKVNTPQGVRELGVVAGVSDDLFGIDVATGTEIWHRHLDNLMENLRPSTDTLCPGGQTGVPALAQVSPGKYTIYAVSWDGRLRQINLADGQDVAPPEKFMPGGGKPYALNLRDGVVYTATAQGCGGLTNAFYSFDLATRKGSAFVPAGGGLWGRRGASIGTDGTVYLAPATACSIREPAARQRDRRREDRRQQAAAARRLLRPAQRELAVAPGPRRQHHAHGVRLQGAQLPRRTSKECRLWLLDRDGLGGEDHRTTLHTTPLICNDAQAFDWRGIWGALSAWQDASGTQWVIAPFWGPVSAQFKAPIEHARPAGGGVAAFKLVERDGGWKLDPAWLSRDMDLAEEAVIANGIVFAYAGGEDATQVVPDKAWNDPGGPVYGGGLSSGPARRIPNSRRAVLYALDGLTGKELWSSGTQIESWNHFSGLTVANGRAYLGTFDGVLYCFGVKQ